MAQKRVQKRFTSQVNIVEFQQPHLIKPKRYSVTLNPRNQRQKEYVAMLQDEDISIVFAVGPAGTGKTMLAVQNGIKLFQEGLIDKIIVTRPAVSVDEELGFLPGTLNEKMAPWIIPILDVFGEYYHQTDIKRMLADGDLEVAPFAMMRGRTFKHAYIIADETQGCTPNQMKMLLTRIGEGSKMVITGDLDQADRGDNNGLKEFLDLYSKYVTTATSSKIQFTEFSKKDIERHPVVTEILSIYEK